VLLRAGYDTVTVGGGSMSGTLIPGARVLYRLSGSGVLALLRRRRSSGTGVQDSEREGRSPAL
jgi:hypothetical protein